MTSLNDFDDLRQVLDLARAVLPDTLDAVAEALRRVFAAGGQVLVCGNGGSASAAQHFCAELVGRFRVDRRPLAALALSADAMAITAIANDMGFDHVFARQVEALARPGDVLVAISTSGRSPNVLAAARTARARGCTVLALTGGDGGTLASLADITLVVPSVTVARIQEVHALCLHAIARAIEEALCYPAESRSP